MVVICPFHAHVILWWLTEPEKIKPKAQAIIRDQATYNMESTALSIRMGMHHQGSNAGFVIKLTKSTLIGFNYRSALSYQFSGSSQFRGTPALTSNNYNFDFWTPARSVLTISHFITPDLGIISTIQRVQWSIFDNVTFHNVATQIAAQSIILPVAVVPYHFHDTWTCTLGGIKKITPKWVIRVAGTFDQSPGNGNYQIANGNSTVIGSSIGYAVYKNIIVDGSLEVLNS